METVSTYSDNNLDIEKDSTIAFAKFMALTVKDTVIALKEIFSNISENVNQALKDCDEHDKSRLDFYKSIIEDVNQMQLSVELSDDIKKYYFEKALEIGKVIDSIYEKSEERKVQALQIQVEERKNVLNAVAKVIAPPVLAVASIKMVSIICKTIEKLKK